MGFIVYLSLLIFEITMLILYFVNGGDRYIVPIIYGSLILPLFISLFIVSYKRETSNYMLLYPYRFNKLILGATVYIITLFSRLFIGEYGGNYNELDFGFKYDGGSNRSFEIEMNSFYHAIQGFTIIFAFEFWYSTFKNKYAYVIISLLPLVSIGYPFYNMTKRFEISLEVIDETSLLNNGLEWCFGCLAGISIGMFLTSIKICINPDTHYSSVGKKTNMVLTTITNIAGSILIFVGFAVCFVLISFSDYMYLALGFNMVAVAVVTITYDILPLFGNATVIYDALKIDANFPH